MTYLTRPFFDFVFFVLPVGLPLLAVDLLALYLIIFKERFEPRSLIFWIAIVLVVPFAGFLAYLLWGCTLFARRTFNRKRELDAPFLASAGDDVPADLAVDTSRAVALGADVPTSGNSTSFYWNSVACLDDAVRDLESARSDICVMAYGGPGGDSLSGLVDAIARRAEDGLDVRMMTSAEGFGRTDGVRRIRRSGGRVRTFHKGVYSTFSIRPSWRNFRTVLIIDGRIAYTGGGSTLRVEGPAVRRMALRFRADWLHGSGEDMGTLFRGECDRPGGETVQVVSAGPDCGGMEPLASSYSSIILSARERLYLTFPYMVPNDELYSSIKLAVLSGVDVRILLPRRGRHWYQSWNSLAASNPLMMAGVKVYFVDDMLSKCIAVADGRVCSIGSGIYNSRSLESDFNSNLVVYSEDLASKVEGCFERALDKAVVCHPEEYEKRSILDMAKIAVARMFMFYN